MTLLLFVFAVVAAFRAGLYVGRFPGGPPAFAKAVAGWLNTK